MTAAAPENGVQLADLLAYSVYRAFKIENFGYPYFERALPNFYRWQDPRWAESPAASFSADRRGAGSMERIQTESLLAEGR